MVKKNTKKTQKKITRPKKTKSSSNEIKINKNIFIALIVAVLAIGLALLIHVFDSPSTNSLVTVNGEEITNADVEKRIALLNNLGYDISDQNQILNELITETLLLQEANRQNIQITNEQVEEELELFVSFNQITREEFESQLELSGVEMDSFREFFTTNVVISRFIEQEISSREITTEEARLFYDENMEIFNMDGTYMEFEVVEEDIKEYLSEMEVASTLDRLLLELEENANIVHQR